MIREAVIPAAGRGARLDRPGTPKPLVDVGGQPMVVRLIRQLGRVGIEKVVVVVGFEGTKIERTLNKYDFDVEVRVVRNENWPEGIASSLMAAKEYVSGRFLLAMADHVFDEVLVETMARCPLAVDEAAALVESRFENVFALDTAVKVRMNGSAIVAMGRDLAAYDGVDAGLFNLPHTVFDSLAEHLVPHRENELAEGFSSTILLNKMRAVTASAGRFDDVDTPAALVHAEMRLRKQQRLQNVKPETTAANQGYRRFNYTVTVPAETEMLVGRGFVRNPRQIQLIPDTAASSPVFVFTDDTVAEIYGRDFTAGLREMGYDVHLIVLPVGEGAKSLTSYAFWVEQVLSRGVDERSLFISLGGGVVCNVCGFVASTIYRGLDLVHIPTTLMSQCDAAISHKQGINAHQGKNLVGAYYSPRLVAVDVDTLSTLPVRLLRDGMAEVIKHAVGQDGAYVDFLLSGDGDIGRVDFLERVIQTNIRLKCTLAAADAKEHREGMILQYGHTVGHAVEHLSGYKLYHGESVAVGMAVAVRVARIMGACNDSFVALHDRLLEKYRLPSRLPSSIHTRDVVAAVRYSKRYLTEGTRMALLSEVGQLWCVDGEFAIPVSDSVLSEALDQCREG